MAKITTITNPLTGQPAQVDQLDHTAQQIDDGVKHALEYGLGDRSRQLTSANDVNTIFRNGWYWWGSDIPQNAPITGFDGNNSLNLNAYTFMRVSNWGSTDVLQEFWNLSNSLRYKSQRIIRSGVVNPIEWVNAPMFLGEEYRTTERYLGKSVYAKVVDLGNCPSSDFKDVEVLGDTEIGFRCEGHWSYGGGSTMPYESTSSDRMEIAILKKSVRIFTGGKDYSSYTATATIYYIKTTD